ncbi:MAG TPA: choice-of-anchor tandem repeat GloVer-containing protein [Candidatus Cybelea sp.]
MRRSLIGFAVLPFAAATFLAGCGQQRVSGLTPGIAPSTRQASAGRSYRLLYSFGGGGDGYWPQADLLAVSGKLYGTAEEGGLSTCHYGGGCGTVFQVEPSGNYRVLHRFSGSQHNDGCFPDAGLIEAKGSLYGTTRSCGTLPSNDFGTVYELSPSGKERVIYGFATYKDAQEPVADLVEKNGTLYGTTRNGGYSGCYVSETCGAMFAVTLSGNEKVLHYFGPGYQEGVLPLTGLTFVKNELYGTTTRGGADGGGAVFKTSTSGSERVVYNFKGGHYSAFPEGQLTLYDGELYGTADGGAYGAGTIYAMAPSGKERMIYTFKGLPNDGARPIGRLTVFNGKLYGVTIGGGAHQCASSGSGCGTVFDVSPSGKESVLYSFAGGMDGEYPYAGLALLNGRLYGTTRYGGSLGCTTTSGLRGCGTIFSIAP